MDVDSIEVGSDFLASLTEAIERARVVVVMIGPRWLDARDSDGGRRLDDPADIVRRELELAVEHQLRVVPVLVGEASVPAAATLPESIASLSRCQAFALTDQLWAETSRSFIDALAAVLDEAAPVQSALSGPGRRLPATKDLVGRQSQLDAAEAGLDAAMRAAERSKVPVALGYAWFGRAVLARARGDLVLARACSERSLVIDEQVNDRPEVPNDRILLVDVCVTLGDLESAHAHSEAIAVLARTRPGPREVGVREMAYGSIALAEGRVGAARVHFLDSLRAFAPTQMTDIFIHPLLSLLATTPPSLAARLQELADDVRGHRLSMPEALAEVERLIS